MGSWLLIIAVLFLPVIVIISWMVLRWARKRAKFVAMMDKLPHTKGHFLLGNLMEFMVPRVELLEARRKFAKRFKDEVLFSYWIGPSDAIVELTKAEAIEVALRMNKNIEKSKFYRYLHPWLGRGLLTSGGSQWRARRKLLTPSFHYSILEQFIDVINEQAIILATKIDHYANEKKPFDVSPLLSLCTLDIICETAMQKKINAQGDSSSEYVRAISGATRIMSGRAKKPWLRFDWLFALTSMGREFQSNLQIMHAFTDQVIAERRGEHKEVSKDQVMNEDDFGLKKRLAFLDTLLDCYENGQKLSDKSLREEVNTFMFAGHDTTSCGIIWTIFLLGNYPAVQDKVHKELDDIFGTSKGALTSSDLKEMKYLECVIKESLRLYPPVPQFGRSVGEDMHIAGHDIPEGVTILCNVFLLHRDPRYFPDPEAFDPDRFLPENSSKRPLYAYTPFSAGPRNCIGQKFALMEEKVVLAHLLHRFKFTSKETREDMKLIGEMVLRPANGLWITVEKRDSASILGVCASSNL